MEGTGLERRGLEWNGKERIGQERIGTERRGTERNGVERIGKERQGLIFKEEINQNVRTRTGEIRGRHRRRRFRRRLIIVITPQCNDKRAGVFLLIRIFPLEYMNLKDHLVVFHLQLLLILPFFKIEKMRTENLTLLEKLKQIKDEFNNIYEVSFFDHLTYRKELGKYTLLKLRHYKEDERRIQFE